MRHRAALGALLVLLGPVPASGQERGREAESRSCTSQAGLRAAADSFFLPDRAAPDSGVLPEARRPPWPLDSVVVFYRECDLESATRRGDTAVATVSYKLWYDGLSPRRPGNDETARVRRVRTLSMRLLHGPPSARDTTGAWLVDAVRVVEDEPLPFLTQIITLAVWLGTLQLVLPAAVLGDWWYAVGIGIAVLFPLLARSAGVLMAIVLGALVLLAAGLAALVGAGFFNAAEYTLMAGLAQVLAGTILALERKWWRGLLRAEALCLIVLVAALIGYGVTGSFSLGAGAGLLPVAGFFLLLMLARRRGYPGAMNGAISRVTR